MPKNYQIDNHEIDLIKLMFTVWKGKWKVIIAVFISLITAIIYQSNQSTNFSSITEVKPLNGESYWERKDDMEKFFDKAMEVENEHKKPH